MNEKYDYQNPFRMSSGRDTNSTRVGAGKRTVSDTLMSWLDGGPRLPSRRRGKSTSRNGEGVQAILDSSHDDTTYLGEERHGLLSDVDSNDYDDEDLDSNQGLELLHHGSGPAVSVSEENIEKNMQSGDATNRQNLQEMSVFEATKS